MGSGSCGMGAGAAIRNVLGGPRGLDIEPPPSGHACFSGWRAVFDVRLRWRAGRERGASPSGRAWRPQATRSSEGLHACQLGGAATCFWPPACREAPLRPEPQALCSGPGSAPWVRAGGCRPPLCPRPHALHLVFADFARTRFKDVRSMVSALEEASSLPQDAASAVPRELGHEKKSAFDNFSGDVGVNPFCL